jgi:anti-sigma regulatory factor (Ser/Thr protein kinase)
MQIQAPQVIRKPADLGFLCAANRSRRHLDINLNGVTWISPMGVVAVLSTCLAATARGIAARVILPSDQTARTYLERVGLYDELGRQGWAMDGDADLDAGYAVAGCVPVHPLHTEFDVDEVANQLDAALREVPVVQGLFDKIMTVAVELTQNAREHGSACYFVAQSHTGATSGTPGIHVAVADFGDGFAATMRSAYGKMTDVVAVRRSFELRVTGTGLPDRGFGLDYVKADIRSHPGAVLNVISRTARVTLNEETFKVNRAPDFRGTIAAAYFPHVPAGV